MSTYLSDEWHAMTLRVAQELPTRDGVSIRMAFVVSGAPGGDRKYFQIVENGKLVDQRNGTIPDADVTMTITWADSVAMQSGELDPNVAMMQGRAKIAGNMGRVMAVLPLSTSAEYASVQQKVAAQTEFESASAT
jgi:putative sterol carrier protein